MLLVRQVSWAGHVLLWNSKVQIQRLQGLRHFQLDQRPKGPPFEDEADKRLQLLILQYQAVPSFEMCIQVLQPRVFDLYALCQFSLQKIAMRQRSSSKENFRANWLLKFKLFGLWLSQERHEKLSDLHVRSLLGMHQSRLRQDDGRTYVARIKTLSLAGRFLN